MNRIDECCCNTVCVVGSDWPLVNNINLEARLSQAQSGSARLIKYADELLNASDLGSTIVCLSPTYTITLALQFVCTREVHV